MSNFDCGATSHSSALGPRNTTIRFAHTLTTDPWGTPGAPIIGAFDDVLVLLFNGTLLNLDLFTGALRWSFPMIAGATSAPTIFNGAVLLADLMGYVYRLDARTGALYWRAGPFPARINADAVASGGAIFIADGDATVRALNFSTGALLWEATAASLGLVGAQFYWRPALAMADGSSPCPEAAGCDTLYLSPWDLGVLSRDAAVLALHAASGALRFRFSWPAPPGTNKRSPSAVAVQHGRAYWAAGTAVFCVNASSGQLLYNATPAMIYQETGSFMVALSRTEDLLIAPIAAAGTFGLRASTGEVLWQNGGSVSTAVGALDGGGVLFMLDVENIIHALNSSTGEQLMIGGSSSGAPFEVATEFLGYPQGLVIGPNGSLVIVGTNKQTLQTLLVIGAPQAAPQPSPSGGGGGAGLGAGAVVGLVLLCICGAAILLAFSAARGRCSRGTVGGLFMVVGVRESGSRVLASSKGVEICIGTEDLHSSLLPSTDDADYDEAVAGRGISPLTDSSGSKQSGLPIPLLEERGGAGGGRRRMAWLVEGLRGGAEGGSSTLSSRQPTLLNDEAVEGQGELVALPMAGGAVELDGDSFVLKG